MTADKPSSNLARLRTQRSHLLFVLSDPAAGADDPFLAWYQRTYLKALAARPGVIGAQHYRRHELDLTEGRFAPLPARYLGIVELSLDGAEEAAELIQWIAAQHGAQEAAQPSATWLYYPASEKVGASPSKQPAMLTLAFANAVDGQENAFRQWYATRHIRHALSIPALVSGQCFERTLYQSPGAYDASYRMIAIYEQSEPAEAVLEGLQTIPPETFAFPAMCDKRFAEWVYVPLGDTLPAAQV